ncbi:MAG: hypothetical protein H7122_05130 [Chitinophagaceae bacterium]|nr:hypothetical protein [Chitinophagaceae bacterium]
MKTPNRDLLVLVKNDHLNEKAIELELEKLNQLLFNFETIDNLCAAHEVFDLNVYKIHNNAKLLKKVISKKHLKPFEFLFNKN